MSYDGYSEPQGSISFAEEVLTVHLVVLLNLGYGQVSQSTLCQVVHLVSPAVLGGLSEGKVNPVGVLSTVSELVVVDGPQSLSEHLRVHLWIHGVSSDTEDGETRQVVSRELLLGEVLIELGIGESLEAVVFLILGSFLLKLVELLVGCLVVLGEQHLPFQ